MQIRLSQTVGIVLVAMLSVTAVAVAQDAAVPTPHTPDLLGIYPGMPMQAAVAQLQKQSSDVYVSTASDGFSLTKDTPHTADVTIAKVTNPPNALPAVWMITRSWSHFSGPEGSMTVSGLMAGLHAKYGQETMRKTGSNGQNALYWIFDRNGKLLAHADPALMNCSGEGYGPTVAEGTIGQPSTDVCARSFFAVTAYFTDWPPGNQIVNAYSVELANVPYALQEAQKITDAKNAAANRAHQAQVQRANGNVPKF
jgi:hypothetical protein